VHTTTRVPAVATSVQTKWRDLTKSHGSPFIRSFPDLNALNHLSISPFRHRVATYQILTGIFADNAQVCARTQAPFSSSSCCCVAAPQPITCPMVAPSLYALQQKTSLLECRMACACISLLVFDATCAEAGGWNVSERNTAPRSTISELLGTEKTTLQKTPQNRNFRPTKCFWN
jgi:hypothetical protein